jgi:PAS domain S-box-containing protein
MTDKPTYEELKQRVKELEKDAVKHERVAEMLNENKRLLNAILESTADGILVGERDGMFSYGNSRFAEMWNIPKEVMATKKRDKLHEIISDQLKDSSAFFSRLMELYQSEDEYLDFVEFKDGRVFERFSTPLNRDGQIAGRVWSFRDITDRKRAEEELRESEERHRLLLEVSPDPIVIYDIEGKATYVNPAFSETFGWSINELLGKRIDFVPEENWPETRAAIRRMIQGEKVQLFETKRFTKDNRTLDIQLSSALFFDRDEKPKGNIVILRDITAQKRAEEILRNAHDEMEQRVKERTAELISTTEKLQQEIKEHQRAEEALRKSRERFRSLTEVTSDWIWEVDENGFYTYSSPKLFEILGYGTEEIVGKTPFDFMPPAEAERVFKIFNEIRASRESFDCLENINLHKNGHSVNIESSGVPTYDTNGKFTGYRGIDRDISERKRVQEELQKAHDELEKRVEERTRELDIQKTILEETNTALQVLLDKRYEDKKEMEENVLTNVKEMMIPYIEKFRKTKLNVHQKTILGILESYLNEIVSPFVRKMFKKYLNLTPTEIEVIHLIRFGSSSKEIADIMGLSPRTIYNHRKNIRKKLGIENKETNLRSHLLSIF